MNWPPDRAAFEALTLEEGRDLAAEATEVLANGGGLRAGKLLLRLVCHLPGVLAGLHDRLLEAGILEEMAWEWHGSMLLHDAGPEVVDRLVAMVDAPMPKPNAAALLAVAWIGDDRARTALARWDSTWLPNAWLYAGWELTDDGGRRDLHRHECFRLRPTPAAALLDAGDRCGGCGGALTALLDLDMTDDRMAFLRIGADRIRLATCLGCVTAGPVFASVDGSGRVAWSEASAIGDGGPQTPPAVNFGLGERRRTPFGGLAFDVEESSQLGGLPIWEQSPEYPRCPRCLDRMPYVGQVSFPTGTVYTFLDPGCATTGAVYQQD